MNAMRVIDQLVLPTLVWFVLVASVAAAVLGAALLVRSAATLRFIAGMNHWYSTRRVLRPLEIPRNVEGAASGAGRPWLGVLIALGGAVALYLLLTRLEFLGARPVGVLELKRWLISTLPLQVLKWFLVLGAAFAMLAGAMIAALPRAWRALEARMNRWYSTRRLLAEGDRMRMPLEALVEAYPRAAGAIIVGASLLVALAMAGLLASR